MRKKVLSVIRKVGIKNNRDKKRNGKKSVEAKGQEKRGIAPHFKGIKLVLEQGEE